MSQALLQWYAAHFIEKLQIRVFFHSVSTAEVGR